MSQNGSSVLHIPPSCDNKGICRFCPVKTSTYPADTWFSSDQSPDQTLWGIVLPPAAPPPLHHRVNYWAVRLLFVAVTIVLLTDAVNCVVAVVRLVLNILE